MAIATSDIVLRLSTTAGSAGDSTASTAAASLGKYVSSTVWAAGTNSLFDDITGAENAANDVEYRCIFVLNNHATLTMLSTVAYISSEVSGGASVALAADSTAISAKGSSTAQALTVADENTAPAGPLTYSSPTAVGTGIALGDIPAGSVKAVWVRRTAANSAALDSDGFTLGIGCDTAA